MAGVPRSEIYMTNLVKCFLPRYRKPRADEIQACAPYLDEEIELIDPAVIAPLGWFANRYVLEKYDLPVPGRSEFEGISGRLLLAGGRRVYPLRHPAALLHNPSLKPHMESTYGKLGVFLAECKWYPVCPMKFYHQAGRLDGEWIDRYCQGDFESCVRYRMEESGLPHSDWMLPDGSEDKSLRD
jgi:DNA polymerase